MSEKNGLYIHIPFCVSKCPYCDFFSVKYDNELASKYVDALISKMKEYEGASFDTVYFGGGTPSALDPQLIEKILNAARLHFDIDNDSEITIECNPSKNLENDFKIYNDCGINRVSIGMQSAVKTERLALGRRAGKEDVKKAIFDSRNAGITNISLDLMIGTPKQTSNGLEETFEFIKEMSVPHISAYMLKIEENTPFYKLQDKLSLPNEDTVCDSYIKAVETLENMGLHQYEVSNFAKTGFESKHNCKYWKLVDYLGLGPSAHSMWNGKRFHYDKDFNKIIDCNGGGDEEKIMLGLRLKKGINKSLINKDIKQYIKAGFMEENGDNVCFTPKGYLVSNTIIADILYD